MDYKNTIKKEMKSAIFVYVISKIIGNIFSFIVGGFIIGVAFIGRVIFRSTLTKEEKNAIDEKYKREDDAKRKLIENAQMEREIEQLRLIKKEFEARQKLLGRTNG